MQLDALIDRLAGFEAGEHPVISLYLDARPDQHGRSQFDAFVRKELPARARTYPERSPERQSFERDIERILGWLHAEARPSANGIAIFASHGAGELFEAVQLDAPMEHSELHVAGAGVADELVTQAQQTSAHVTFIEDPALLADVGGVAAVLRYRIERRAA
jgi:peptide subunit release factor 1 (eRF1)